MLALKGVHILICEVVLKYFLLLRIHVLNQVKDTVGVSSLVIIPRNKLDIVTVSFKEIPAFLSKREE